MIFHKLKSPTLAARIDGETGFWDVEVLDLGNACVKLSRNEETRTESLDDVEFLIADEDIEIHG